MKKTILITLAIFLNYCYLFSQSDKGDFTLAPQIGLNFSTYLAGDSDITYDSRRSFAGGLVGEYYFSNRWSLRTGLLYDPMGAEDGGNNVDKLNYLTIPINANWHFGSSRNWYLNFGLGISFLLNAEADLSDGTTIDIKDFVPSTDISFPFGIGYKFDISDNFQLYIDYQVFVGFTNLDEANNLPFDITNSRSSFNLGGVFKL